MARDTRPTCCILLLGCLLSWAGVACSSDTTSRDAGAVDSGSESGSSCGPDERLHPVTGECRAIESEEDTAPSPRDVGTERAVDATSDVSSDDTDANENRRDTREIRDVDDTGTDDTTGDDTGGGSRRDTGTDGSSRRDGSPGSNDADGGASCPDRDNDGFRAESCGGRDCNDRNRRVNPGLNERCSAVDDDCDGRNNEQLECSFIAHNPNQVYRVDPFKQQTRPLSTTNEPDSQMFDMDTHPNGTLYVVTQQANIWKHDPSSTNKWTKVGSTGITDTLANGLAINRAGEAFVTAQSGMYKVDLQTAKATKLSDLGSFRSSGDCVVTEGGRLLMTAINRNPLAGDHLVRVDQQTGTVQKLGTLGHADVWGLTAAWGNLYGMTKGGTLVRISGQGSRVVTNFSGANWYGAASTPASRRGSSP